MAGKDNPEVGVAIPVFNDEKVLADAVASVQAQTLSDWEIVIVDDGSTDGTAKLADELAASDSRIRVIHQENQGSYMARTNGMLASTAEYLTALDADDTIAPEMFEAMLDLAKRENLDLIECDLSIATGDDGCIDVLKSQEEVQKYYIDPVYLRGEGFLCVCGKLYRRRLLFEEGRHESIIKQRVTLFDDALFNTQILYAVGSYGRIHKPFYRYRITSGSSVRNFNPSVLPGFETAVRARREFAPRYGIAPDDWRLIRWIAINALNLVALAASAPQDSWRTNVAHVREVLALSCVQETAVMRKKGLKQLELALLNYIPACLIVALAKAKKSLKRK